MHVIYKSLGFSQAPMLIDTAGCCFGKALTWGIGKKVVNKAKDAKDMV